MGKRKQDRHFREGRSKVKFPDGKHNVMPSRAVDVVPYPIDWEDRERFHYFAGFCAGGRIGSGCSTSMGRGLGSGFLRWTTIDFDDLPHFELAREED